MDANLRAIRGQIEESEMALPIRILTLTCSLTDIMASDRHNL